MPPAVALLNYISCGILWRIFSQTGIFVGFFYVYLFYFAGRISAAVIAGYIGQIYAPGSPSLGLKRSILFQDFSVYH